MHQTPPTPTRATADLTTLSQHPTAKPQRHTLHAQQTTQSGLRRIDLNQSILSQWSLFVFLLECIIMCALSWAAAVWPP